jgi:hypothetical protein
VDNNNLHRVYIPPCHLHARRAQMLLHKGEISQWHLENRPRLAADKDCLTHSHFIKMSRRRMKNRQPGRENSRCVQIHYSLKAKRSVEEN